MVLPVRNALISAPVRSTARADPIRPTTPVLTTTAHAIKRMILSSLKRGRCRTGDRVYQHSASARPRGLFITELDLSPASPADIGAVCGRTSARTTAKQILFCLGARRVHD